MRVVLVSAVLSLGVGGVAGLAGCANDPVYIPAPIYYPHYETPGITIVIPLDLR